MPPTFMSISDLETRGGLSSSSPPRVTFLHVNCLGTLAHLHKSLCCHIQPSSSLKEKESIKVTVRRELDPSQMNITPLQTVLRASCLQSFVFSVWSAFCV